MQDIEVLDPSLQIKVGSFEGPLDLLLHLIKKHELNILDLPIAFVTEAYCKYLDLMHSLNLDVASEYLVMAATLVHIKSKMLLPIEPEEHEASDLEEDAEDPRAELIRKLLEYQKYKDAAVQLNERDLEGRDAFVRGGAPTQTPIAAKTTSYPIFSLVDAFERILRRVESKIPFVVTPDQVSIQERMTQITDRLLSQKQVAFETLFSDDTSVGEVVVTFLAILEMAKQRLLAIYQNDLASPIYLELQVSAESDHAENLHPGVQDDDPYRLN